MNSEHRGFMAVRRRGITPVVSRYILKSRVHARKSRTKLHTGRSRLWKSRASVARVHPMAVWRDLPLGGTPDPAFMPAAVFHGFACNVNSATDTRLGEILSCPVESNLLFMGIG